MIACPRMNRLLASKLWGSSYVRSLYSYSLSKPKSSNQSSLIEPERRATDIRGSLVADAFLPYLDSVASSPTFAFCSRGSPRLTLAYVGDVEWWPVVRGPWCVELEFVDLFEFGIHEKHAGKRTTVGRRSVFCVRRNNQSVGAVTTAVAPPSSDHGWRAAPPCFDLL